MPASFSLRTVFTGVGGLLLLLAVGFIFRLPLVFGLWPWPDSPLSYTFVGSIIAAMAVAFVWIGLSSEWGAAAAGAITGLIIAGGMGTYLFWLSLTAHRPLFLYALPMVGVVVVSIGLLLWSRGKPLQDQRPMPGVVRISFAVFVVVLVLAATALVLRTPNIFPWTLNPDSSVMFGCIFYGDAAYFLYALFFRQWHYAQAQLLSFLAYDLVLLPVFLPLFATVKPAHRESLVLYVAVLIYSGGLAIYYLFLNKATRAWGIQEVKP